jgi:PAS domain S-box-containing protein
MGQGLHDVWPELWEQAEPMFTRVLLQGESIRHQEATFRTLREGHESEAHFAYSLTPLRADDGSIIGVFNVMEETTPFVRARDERDRRYRVLFGHIEEAFCVVEPILDASGASTDFRYLEVNPAFVRRTGYTEAVGKTARELNPRLEPQWPETVQQVADSGAPRHVEGRFADPERWLEVFAFKIEDSPNARVGLLFRDVTERKRADLGLREVVSRYEEQVRLFESVTSTTPDFVYVFNREGRFVYANRRLLEVWGVPLADALGKTCRELGYEQWHHDMHMAEIAQVIATKRPIKGEVPFQAPLTGIFGIYEYIFTPVLGPSGEVELIAGTTRDVTDRKRMEDELRAIKEQLEEADRRKDHFLAVLSHELRNPLAPIKNSLYILDRAVPGGDQARRAKDVVERQVDQLSHLVDDLLDVTRITRGKIQLQRRRLELNELVRRTLEDHRALFETAGVRLELAPAREPVFIDGDWSRIAQVVSNLLQNSVKFTPRDGHVRVSVVRETESQQAEIRVADTGAGMSQDLLSRLFQPFMQADETLDRSKGGLGLGLALVRGIVELHGGSIHATSPGPNRGSEFVVRLPLDLGAPDETEHTFERTEAARHRVLIIEDNADAADSLQGVLELQGHAVFVAHDGVAGLELARKVRPDVVLCDIGLPGMDGYEVARALRSDERLRKVRVVALSGYAQPEDLRRAARAGFDAHLAKPPSLEKLEAVLNGRAAPH